MRAFGVGGWTGRGKQTRRYLKVLISPKRSSTRRISRLSDRLAGRGMMRRWTEREERSCEDARRTDMMGRGAGVQEMRLAMLARSSHPRASGKKSDVGPSRQPGSGERDHVVETLPHWAEHASLSAGDRRLQIAGEDVTRGR